MIFFDQMNQECLPAESVLLRRAAGLAADKPANVDGWGRSQLEQMFQTWLIVYASNGSKQHASKDGLKEQYPELLHFFYTAELEMIKESLYHFDDDGKPMTSADIVVGKVYDALNVLGSNDGRYCREDLLACPSLGDFKKGEIVLKSDVTYQRETEHGIAVMNKPSARTREGLFRDLLHLVHSDDSLELTACCSLAAALLNDPIKRNSVIPTLVYTEMTDLKFEQLTPEALALYLWRTPERIEAAVARNEIDVRLDIARIKLLYEEITRYCDGNAFIYPNDIDDSVFNVNAGLKLQDPVLLYLLTECSGVFKRDNEELFEEMLAMTISSLRGASVDFYKILARYRHQIGALGDEEEFDTMRHIMENWLPNLIRLKTLHIKAVNGRVVRVGE